MQHGIAPQKLGIGHRLLLGHLRHDMEMVGLNCVGYYFDPAVVRYLPQLLAQYFLSTVFEQVLTIDGPGHAVVEGCSQIGVNFDPWRSHPPIIASPLGSIMRLALSQGGESWIVKASDAARVGG